MKYKTIDFRIEKNNPKYLKLTPEVTPILIENRKNEKKYYVAKLGGDYIEGEIEKVLTECPFCEKIYKDFNPVVYSKDKRKRILESFCPICNKFAFVYQETYGKPDGDNEK